MTERPLIDLHPAYINAGDLHAPAGTCGFSFMCPVCNAPHHICVFWDKGGHPHRNVWDVQNRESFKLITVVPSVLADTSGRCKFHGWIRNGQVTW